MGPTLAGSSGRTSLPAAGPSAPRDSAAGDSAHRGLALPRRARTAPRPDAGLGAGRQLNAVERSQYEPALEVDLSGVRVHDGAAARRAAAARGAHAFTFGNHIVLGRTAQVGGPRPRRQVLAHELVHVRQQSIGGCAVGAANCRGPPGSSALTPPARAPPATARVQCWDAGDLVPGFVSDAADAVVDTGAAAVGAVADAGEAALDWVLDGVRSAARALPGYSLIADVIGRDPLTGERVTVERGGLVELVLTYGPFGPAVAAVLETAEVIGEVFNTIATGLATNNLTFDRIVRDVASAFDEFTLSNGIDANLAILRRYLDAFLGDIASFVGGIADRVIEIVRSVAASLVEPLLESEPIKPVWDLARQVLHVDPLRGTEVQTPTVEILANFLRLIGQEDVLAQMQERGTLQQTADWLDTQFATFSGLLAQLGQLFLDAWDAIQPANLPNLLDTFPGLVQRAFGLVQGVASFAGTVIAKVLELVKAALLGWLAEYADEIPGFHLISVILERDPFTGEAVPRTAENLIRGFITLLPGGAATYASLAESGVIGDAAARIEGAMTELGITWELVTSTFLGVWNMVTLENLLDPIGTFVDIVGRFGEPIARIVTFVSVVVRVVVELILRLMNFPTELLGSIISNVLAAIADIARDPVGFLVNLVAALRDGFVAFFGNIVTHLAGGLQAWLFRGLGELGITIPSQWSLAAALDLVLQVLGLTMDFLWRKLEEHIGEERVEQIRSAIDHLTGAWAFIRDVQQRGMAALWDVISSQLSSLWSTVVGMAMEWIMTRIIASATAKLLAFLDPTGIMAIINGTIAFFNAVQSAIEYLHDMLEILNMYVSTLASVAAGDIEPGARMIEQGLAAVIPIAIGFLANQVGLGGIPDRIVAIIEALRETVEQAVDWLITQALRLGSAALNALGMGGTEPEEEPAAQEPVPEALDPIDEPVVLDGVTHHLKNDGPGGVLALHSDQVLVNTIDEPDLQTLVQQYNAATTKVARTEATKAIAAWLALHNPIAGPGGSAPGLGTRARHGIQPIRIRTSGVPLWELESEHVVPFVVMRGLWTSLGTHSHLVNRPAMSTEDRNLTTIMIYKGAADAKTGQEGSRRSDVAAQLTALGNAYWSRDDAGDPGPEAQMRSDVIGTLNGERTYYAGLTREAVESEHETAIDQSTHGTRRAEDEALPSAADIGRAAEQEVSDAVAILDEALAELARP